MNVWAVLLATVVYFAFGALWYMALSRPWMAAVGFTRADVDDRAGGRGWPWGIAQPACSWNSAM